MPTAVARSRDRSGRPLLLPLSQRAAHRPALQPASQRTEQAPCQPAASRKAGPTPVCKRRETTVENEQRHSCTRSDVLAPRRKSWWFVLWLTKPALARTGTASRQPSERRNSALRGEYILLGRVHKTYSTQKHRTWIRNSDMISRAKNRSNFV